MTNPPATPPMRHLTIQNRVGSRQHFYHFLLGVLLPLCRYLALTGEAGLPLIVRSCGPCDAILHELDLPQLLLAEQKSHQNLGDRLPPEVIRKVAITGFDIGPGTTAYDRQAIVAGAGWLLNHWRPRIAAHCSHFLSQWSDRPRILVVDRGPPDPFYATDLSERPKRGSGLQRRRIANHAEMVAEVKRRYPGCRNMLLEGIPLAAQIALFQIADVVVAQHGVALTNVIWMRTDAEIIELAGGAPEIGFFIDLAATLGLRHRFFPQDGPFGPVEGAALAAAIGGNAERRAATN